MVVLNSVASYGLGSSNQDTPLSVQCTDCTDCAVCWAAGLGVYSVWSVQYSTVHSRP